MKINVAAVGLAHPFEVGYDQAPALLNQTAQQLAAIGVDCVNTGVVMHDLPTVKEAIAALKQADADVLLICVATWSEDHHLLDLLDSVDLPVILRAYPARDTGSLCCVHQIGAVFTNIQRLRMKESDRVEAVVQMIRSLGGKAEADDQTLTVFGSGLTGGTVNAFHDHRIAMSAAIAAAGCKQPVTILDAECVQKSYPLFWEEYKRLGGNYEQHIR